MNNPFARAFFDDYIKLEQDYNEWCRKSVPPCKITVQSFLVYLKEKELIDNDVIHAFVRDLEEGG